MRSVLSKRLWQSFRLTPSVNFRVPSREKRHIKKKQKFLKDKVMYPIHKLPADLYSSLSPIKSFRVVITAIELMVVL